MTREAGLRRFAHPLEHLVDVDCAALDRPMVGKRLHAIDQRHDAVGLVANQLGQFAAGRIGILLEELRRAADAGKRVLDLVRQHRGHRRYRSRRAAMGQIGGPSFPPSSARAVSGRAGRPPRPSTRPVSSPNGCRSAGLRAAYRAPRSCCRPSRPSRPATARGCAAPRNRRIHCRGARPRWRRETAPPPG